MTKAIFILTLTLFTFSLIKSAKITDEKATTESISRADMKGNDQEIILDMDRMTAMDQCNETFRTDMNFLQALNESGSFPDETDRTPKCYVRCVLEKTGAASQDGIYDPARTAVAFFGERGGKVMDDLKDIATDCASNRDESCKCERAYQFVKCLMENEIQRYEKGQ